ncbi:MAG: hypothetical protein JWM91_3230 [Rhodospirillales bacterium]|nr:hypothetical protein [Rhodospirillales bacterium]
MNHILIEIDQGRIPIKLISAAWEVRSVLRRSAVSTPLRRLLQRNNFHRKPDFGIIGMAGYR